MSDARTAAPVTTTAGASAPAEPDTWLPTPAHVIYIPAMLLLGLVVGYTLGARAVRAEQERARQRLRE
ncbi:MAG: hypothetical protein IT376_14395 [Polyangiaceae bacterium]|nr:hypothetical protein [Polyangiaceae bacterium]